MKKYHLNKILIGSFITIMLGMVFALLLLTNTFFEHQFQNYLTKNQIQKQEAYTEVLAKQLYQNRDNQAILIAIGQQALADGLILTVQSPNDDTLLCMQCLYHQECEDMIGTIIATMEKHHQGGNGGYTETNYPLVFAGESVGSVTMGFYGPFHLSETDLEFINIFNQLLLIVGAVFSVLTISSGFIIAKKIAKPLKNVTQKTQAIGNGDLNVRIEATTNIIEIDELINSVNTLANSLQLQHKLKKRLANDYAHEFRTPLTTMQVTLEAIIDGVFAPTPERLEVVRQEILRLERLVTEIDKLVEIESTIQCSKKKTDVSKLLEKIVVLFEAEVTTKKLVLVSELLPQKMTIDVDKLTQVFVNVIANAIQYTEKGTITIRMTARDDAMWIDIVDTGVGIGSTDLPHIFDYLYRADHSRNRETGGSGIGLAVAKSIVEAHNGEIQVTSELGKGTCVRIILPNK